MKTYIGIREMPADEAKVFVREPGKTDRPLDPRTDLRNHSPDGFEWGYHGSGPAQLAIALIADAIGNDEIAGNPFVYRQMVPLIAALDRSKTWELSQLHIANFVASFGEERHGGSNGTHHGH